MASDPEPADDLDVRLRWPAGGGDGHRGGALGGAALPALSPRPANGPGEVLLPGRATALHEALAALSARVEALGSATSTFRTVVGERLDDVVDQLTRSQTGTGQRMDEGRRVQERIMSGIEASLEEVELGMSRLDAVATSLLTRFDEVADELAELVGTGSDALSEQVAGQGASLVRAVETRGDEMDRALAALRDLTEAKFEELGDKVGRGPAEVDLSPLERRLDELTARTRSAAAAERTDEVLAAIGEVSSVVDALAEVSEDSASSPLAVAVASLEAGLERQSQLGEQVGALTKEVGALRRRLAVRAKPLDDEAITALADALATRIARADPSAARKAAQTGPVGQADTEAGSRRRTRET